MLIRRLAFCFSSSWRFSPRTARSQLWRTDERRQKKWMNECMMNGNGLSVCRSREAERVEIKRESERIWRMGGMRGMPGILLLKGVLTLFLPLHTHTDVYTPAAVPKNKADMHMKMVSVSARFFLANPESDCHCQRRKWKGVGVNATPCGAVALSAANDCHTWHDSKRMIKYV